MVWGCHALQIIVYRVIWYHAAAVGLLHGIPCAVLDAKLLNAIRYGKTRKGHASPACGGPDSGVLIL